MGKGILKSYIKFQFHNIDLTRKKMVYEELLSQWAKVCRTVRTFDILKM
jgi:hypothetical protein